jgi:uncharacterized integral membrane protein
LPYLNFIARLVFCLKNTDKVQVSFLPV